MTIRWPDVVLRPQSVAFNLAARTLAGASSISGASQVISSSAGIWTATFDSVVVNTRDRVLTWRAIAAMLEGRLGAIEIPLCRGYQPIPDGAVAAGLYDQVPHSDDALFSDDTGYVGSVVDVQLTTAVPVGAATASVSITYADTLQPGQHFSIGNRLYRLKTVSYTAASTADITFSPPARDAVSIGARLNFDDPVCRMRLAGDQEMNLLLEGRRRAEPTVNFVEDI